MSVFAQYVLSAARDVCSVLSEEDVEPDLLEA